MGITNDIDDRVGRHNKGESLSTKGGVPWQLLHTMLCADKSAAMILEVRIKKRGIRRYLSDNDINITLDL